MLNIEEFLEKIKEFLENHKWISVFLIIAVIALVFLISYIIFYYANTIFRSLIIVLSFSVIFLHYKVKETDIFTQIIKNYDIYLLILGTYIIIVSLWLLLSGIELSIKCIVLKTSTLSILMLGIAFCY